MCVKQGSLLLRVYNFYVVDVQHSGATHHGAQRRCRHGYFLWWIGAIHGWHVGFP
jgi:hypothetical protein